MKILWLDINSSYSHSSLAIPALDAQLDDNTREMHVWKVLHGTIKSEEDSIIGEITDFSPQLVLSTLWLFNHQYVMNILKKASRLVPEMKIMLGGPEFLSDNRNFLTCHPEITAVFKGEGEDMFNGFIQNPATYTDIEGFCYLYRNEDGQIMYHDSPAVRVKDFTSLRYPEESDLFEWGKSFIQIETSRGCFNTCRFCISGSEKGISEIPIEKLRQRFDHAFFKGIRNIRILDRTFNANASRAMQLIELFMEYSGKIRFHIEVHPAFLSEKFAGFLKTVPDSLLHIETGLQSLEENVLATCGRKGGAAASLEGIARLRKLRKGEIHTDLIAGLPGYSLKALAGDTVTLASMDVDEIQLELLKLLPGTPFRDESEHYGITWSPIPPYEVLHTDAMDFRDLTRAKILSKAIDYWYNDRNWRPVFNTVFDCSEKLLEFIEFLEGSEILSKPFSLEKKGIVLSEYTDSRCSRASLLMAVQWIKNGLSLKKGPGLKASTWKAEEGRENPLAGNGNRESKYYYIDTEEDTHWFRFDRDDKGRRLTEYKVLERVSVKNFNL